ncbi:Proteasome activator BLM10, partial [Coemansia sp. RSA 552]
MRLEEVNWAKLLPYDRGNEDVQFVREFVAQFKQSTLSGNLPAIAAVLSQLDRSEDVLTSSELTLDWRCLYDLARSLIFPKIWQDNPIQHRFFPPSVAEEVFEELLPQIQFNSQDWQLATIQLLNLFVPVSRPASPVPATDAEAAAADPTRWLPTIFSLWSFNLRTSYDAYFMGLVTYLVSEQRGHFKLTNEQIRFGFASGLHFFNLPISRGSATLPRTAATTLTDTWLFYRMPANGSLPLREERALTFARFIVYTIHDESPGGTLELFEQLVQMIEPFYHPSNNGSWSNMLARFLRHLAKELVQRCRTEADSKYNVLESARLSRTIRRRFVVSVRTLATLLLFSKGEDLVGTSHSTLKYLADVEPDLVFRPLLDTLYTAVDSVTETHRMISAMRALSKLASTLSNFEHYPEGAQHIAPLLMLTLPGIDVNDPTKSFFALSFVCHLCHNGVVFEELPALGDMPGPRSMSTTSSAAIDEDAEIEVPPEPDMDQIEWATRASTAQFETWIDQFLRRVFVLMDNLSSSLDATDAASADLALEMMTAHTTELVLRQCSARYTPMITRLITGFVTSITSLSAVDAMGKIVYAFAGAIPEQALTSLLPQCCDRIAEEIENGVGLTPSLSRSAKSHSETTLIWYASMLSALTEGQDGRSLLPYKKMVMSTLELLLTQCMSRHVYTVANGTLYNIMASLTRTFPLHRRSVPRSVWEDPEFHENHFRYWGQHPDVSGPEFEIEWHIPGRDEIEFALEIVRGIIAPKAAELTAFVGSNPQSHVPTKQDSVSLNRLLAVLRNGVRALGSLIPPPGQPIAWDELSDALIEGGDSHGMAARYRLGCQVPAGYVFTDPASDVFQEIARVREDIGQATLKTLAYMADNSEGNVENIKCLQQLAQAVICHHGIDRAAFANFRRSWNFGMEGILLDSSKTIMPRHFAIRRALYTQASRMFHNTRFMPKTELYAEITSHIARFCVSAYSEIRNYAITALDNITSVLPAVKYPLIPQFLAELDDTESSDPERMIGALRALDALPIRRACLRNWEYFPAMVLALCRAQHEDKPVVKKLIRSTAVSQVVHVAAPLPVLTLTPATQKRVYALDGIENAGIEAAVARDRESCEQRYCFARTENSRLINALVDILRDAGTTWRFAAISGYYLDQLSCIREPPEQRLLATLAENLTSDLVLFRESAAINLAQLLGKIKHRSKASQPDLEVSKRRVTLDPSGNGNAVLGGREYTNLCEQALEGNQEAAAMPYSDNPASGWLVWPSVAKAYKQPPQSDAVPFDSIDPESRPAYDAVHNVLFAAGKWEQLAKLFSIESTRSPDEDTFGVSRAALFNQIFSLFGLPLFEKAWEAIDRLARDNERIGAQRAASEIIGGLLRGSKHWSQASLNEMWKRLVPLLAVVLSKLSPDNFRFWQTCLQYAFARRDPRRYLPLIRQLVYGNPFDPQSEAPFVEAAKLELLRVLISSWDWRIASTILASKPRLLDALAHPYKQVRDVAGVVMYMLSSAEFSVSYPTVAMAIDDLARYGSTGRDFSHWSGSPRTQSLIREMAGRVTEWKADHVPSNEGTSNYSRGSKTLLMFFMAGFGYSSRRLAIDHIPSILSLVSVLQEQHDDDEVSRLAKAIMQLFSQILYTAQISQDVATKILALLGDSSRMWHVVTKTLPLLCTLTFSNRFTLSRSIRSHILDTTAQFLEHEQIEVRQTAASALTSLIKCASSKVIAENNAKFSAKLARRLPRVRHGKSPKDPVAYNSLVLTRHAGVLGLSCLVLAFPYAIPDWLPEVLVRLAECVDDPNPIQSTVQRTFAEF